MTTQMQTSVPKHNTRRGDLFWMAVMIVCVLVTLYAIVLNVKDTLSACNGNLTKTIELPGDGHTGISHVQVCANGSHWRWEKDPGVPSAKLN